MNAVGGRNRIETRASRQQLHYIAATHAGQRAQRFRVSKIEWTISDRKAGQPALASAEMTV